MTGSGENPAPLFKSVMYELMETTEHVARNSGVSIFAVMDENAERVIMVINYMIEKAENAEKPAREKTQPKKVGRADDGFWDF